MAGGSALAALRSVALAVVPWPSTDDNSVSSAQTRTSQPNGTPTRHCAAVSRAIWRRGSTASGLARISH